MMIKVSVIIPVYNSHKYFEQCLDSILNQTLKEIEVICVDDGSTDDSVKMIKNYQKKDSRVKLIKQKNQYAGAARNNGLKIACGEYVVFVDSDDFFEKDMLQSMYEKAVKDNAQICLCSGRIFNESTGEYKDAPHYLNVKFLPKKTPFSADDISARIFNAIAPNPWTKMFKKEYIDLNHFEFQQIKKTNDLFFVYSALACAESITYVNKQFVNYRTGNGQSLQGGTGELTLDFYTALFGLRKELISKGLFQKFEQSFENRALSTCLYVLNRAVSKENYMAVADKLRTKYFYKLGVLGHSSGYFYIKKDFYKLLDVMQKTPEELWLEKSEPQTDSESEKQPEPFDISKWQNPLKSDEKDIIKVSVIIPVYNVEQYLEQCVDSVINNTLKEIEIICVDDGSTDNSPQILKNFAQKDKRIKIVTKENGGLSSARNAGLNAAGGKYILFLDSDDYIEPFALEYLYCEAVAADLDQLFFSAKLFYDEGYTPSVKMPDYTRKGDYSGVMSGREMFCLMSENAEFKPSACLQLIKRKLLEDNAIRFIEGILYEDNPFTINCLFLSKRVKYENIAFYNRRMRGNSIVTGTSALKSSLNYFYVLENIKQMAVKYNFLSDQKFFAALLKQLRRYVYTSSDMLEKANDEDVESLLLNLDEQTGIEFYCFVRITSDLRKDRRELNSSAKRLKEKVAMDNFMYKCKNLECEEKIKELKEKIASKPQKKRFFPFG